jgi:dethiobiotin synthetase
MAEKLMRAVYAACYSPRMHGFYVTGTDTGIGKTRASAALLHALRAQGLRATGMKPVASGCERIDGEWKNADALALIEASDPRPSYADCNPFALPLPLAPELAARDAGIAVELQPILAARARLAACADAVVVEGVGGWAAPLSSSLMQADLARALDMPVVLVVGLRLGCLNHALLSARAIAADGCRLVGWIANGIDPGMEAVEDNIAMLRERLPSPCWGVLPFDPAADGAAFSRLLHAAN